MASFTLAPAMPVALRAAVPRKMQRKPFVVRASVINESIDKGSDRVVTTCSTKDIDGKAVFCRCWKSTTFPYCDASHLKHNKATGDNVGPLILDAAAAKGSTPGPLSDTSKVVTDPMEEYCAGNEDADECRVYDD